MFIEIYCNISEQLLMTNILLINNPFFPLYVTVLLFIY